MGRDFRFLYLDALGSYDCHTLIHPVVYFAVQCEDVQFCFSNLLLNGRNSQLFFGDLYAGHTLLELPDILVPEFRMASNEIRHYLNTGRVFKHDD